MIKDKRKNEGGNFSRNIISGTLSMTASALIVKFIGLIYKIPISSLLGDVGMGYFNSAYTMYSFFYLLCTAGVPKAIMIVISEARVKGRSVDEKKIMSVAYATFISLGIFLCAALILFARPLAELIGNKPSCASMISIAPSILFVSIGGVIRGYLSAGAQLGEIAVSGIIESVGKLGVGLALAMIGKRMNLPLDRVAAMTIFGVTVGAFFGSLYLYICSKKQKTGEKAEQSSPITATGVIIKRILSISIPITLSAAILSITGIIDLGLIMRSLSKLGYSDNVTSALYGNYTTIAVPMFNLSTALISPISIAFLPVFTRHIVSSDNDGFIKAEKQTLDLTCLLCAPLTFGFIVYSKEIITLLFPSSELHSGAALLCFISPAILFSSSLLIVNTILEARGIPTAPLVSMTVGGIVKALSSYLLITETDLGILGAPLGTVISYGAALLVSMLMYVKTFKRHFPIFERAAVPYSISFISLILSRIVYDNMISVIDFLPAFIISVLCAALIYLVFSTLFGTVNPFEYFKMAKYTNLPE